METIAHHQSIATIVGLVIAGLGLVFGLPTLFTYIGNLRREKRLSRVRRVLLDFGPTDTGSFMFRCKQLSATERDKALDELEQTGEIVPHEDTTGRNVWSFKVHPREVQRKH